MHRDPLQTLVHLVATEANPHQLVLRLVSESVLLNEAQRLSRKRHDDGLSPDGRLAEFCRTYKIPSDYFLERLQLVARILNLVPYEQNYYEILGLDRSAGQQEIKKAFRRLSFASHPDTNPDDPNAAERFHNIQQAYEVLNHDMLRHRYDRNLESHAWDEEENREGEAAKPARLRKWYKAWPIGVLFGLLVVMTFVVDYRQWQAERYYKETKMVPARIGGDSSSSSSPAPPDSANDQTKQKSAPIPDVTLIDPGAVDVIPRASATMSDAKGPPEATPIQGVSTRVERIPAKAEVGDARSENPPAASLSSSQHTAVAKPPQQIPPTVSPTRPYSSPSGNEERTRQQSAEKPKEPALASSGIQPAASATTAGPSGAPGRWVSGENLDREIRAFLFRYTSTYETKKIGALLRFFETDAIENGRPIQELVPFYQANFQRAERLRYRIDVGRWEVGEGEVMVDGSFSLFIQFGSEAPVESTGSIQLTLVRRGEDFLVKRLNYSFKESRKIAD